MSEKLGAVLIAVVGSITTRVTLVDTVDGESRLIGQAETPSSTEPPYRDALIGVLEAAVRISEASGRQLLQEGRLLMPQNNERDGINHLVLTTSAAGNMELIITAIARDVSACSALRATRGTYTTVLQTVTLDDGALDTAERRTTSWVERQIQTLLPLSPDVILLAGGLEDGAHEVLCRLAKIVAFTVEHMKPNADKHQSRDSGAAFPVLYAGNSEARDCVQETLANRARTFVVDNVRPTLEHESLGAARAELTRLYDELILSRLPGINALKKLCSTPITTVCHAQGLMTRFMAERYEYKRQVLSLDVGSTSSSALLASPGSYTPAVIGLCGTGYGLTEIMRTRGLENIARWLPFRTTEKDLRHWLLNKALRPHIIPSSREDILLEHAITREALTMALEALRDECETLQYDLVVAGGGVLAHAPHPGLAALTILDALQPTAENNRALDMRLDILGLLPACGALAALDTDSAVTLFDRDVLRNEPLATCIVALGGGKPGQVAIEAELTTRRGRTRRVSVQHGQIARLPLSQGMSGRLTLRPASGVRIGTNAPGEEVPSDAPIEGSALGVIIDARGRPLKLARGDVERRKQLWEWLVALGAEQGRSPYLDASVVISAPTGEETEAVQAPTNGKRTAAPLPQFDMPPVAEQAPAEPPPPPPPAPTPQAESPPDMPLPPASAAEEEPPQPQKGSRISLEDLAGAGEPPPKEPPQPQKGSRISLEDLAGAGEPPPKEPPQPQKGSRISLEDLAGESPSAAPEADTLQNDLAQLRQSLEEPEEKRGLFGRKKKKK